MTSKWLLTAGGFLSFFVFGFVDNLKGPLLPEILRSGECSYSQAGTIVLAAYLGFIVATLASGLLADAISNRSVLLLAAICLCIASVGFNLTHSYYGLVCFMAVMGVGLGAIELGGNGLIVELHQESRGRYLNLLSMFHGCGSLLVPLYAAWLVTTGVRWQLIYGSSILLAAPLLLAFWPSGKPQRNQPTTKTTGWQGETFWQVGFSGRMMGYYVLIATYVAVELSVAAWLVEFLQHERGMSIANSSLFLSSFFVLLMLGRLVGALVVEQFDYMLAVALALTGSGLCLFGGIFGGEWLVWLLPISGFFMSIVFPTVTAAVTDLHPKNTGTILGILFSCGGLGGAIGPWTVGLVSDAAGLKIGFASSIVFALLALLTLAYLKCVAPPVPRATPSQT